MIWKLLISCLLLSSLAHASDQDTLKQLNSLKKIIKENHSKEFVALRSWSKSNFDLPYPTISQEMIQIFSQFEGLYAEYLNQHDFKDNKQQENYRNNQQWFAVMNRQINEKILKGPIASASSIYALLSYFQYSESVALTSSTASAKLKQNFSGLSAGMGTRHEQWRFQGEIFFANGDIISDELKFLQKSALTIGVMGGIYYTHVLSENLSALYGGTVTYRTLRTQKSTSVKVELESSFIFGPEAALNYQWPDSLFMQGGLAYLQSSPAFKLGIGYNFP